MSGAIDPVDDERFLRLFKAAAGFRAFAPHLRTLLAAVFASVGSGDAPAVHAGLAALFAFLSTAEGRTDANCSVTDAFFAAAEEVWRESLERLPPELGKLIASVSGSLHDAVFAEPIARTFGSLPEQLLERLRAIQG